MAHEFKKPTAWDVTTGMSAPGNSYDAGNTSETSGDTTTSNSFSVAGTTSAAATRTSIAYAWATPGQTYTDLKLKMRISATVSDSWNYSDAGGSIGISYTLNDSSYTSWWAWDSGAAGSGPFTQGPLELTPISLPLGQDFTKLKVKVTITGEKGYKVPICKFDDVCAYDGEVPIAGGSATVDIFDIYTDGTYTSGSISGFSTGLAVPPVKVPYGSNPTLTCTFSGAPLSVSPGTWGTWSSGVGQSAGPVFTDTTWTATCGSAQAQATLLISTPSVSAVTFSKNPATVGDTVLCYATVSNATGIYTSPSFYVQSGPPAYDGAWANNGWVSFSPGTYEIRATIGGPVAYTVYGSGSLTFYAAATGSLSGPAATTVNQTYAVTPTFANGAAVLGTTQGASDIATGITSGSNYNRTAPASPGSQTTWMRVTNPAGDYIDRSFTTTTYAAPTAAISASTTSPLWGAPNVTVTPVGGGDPYQIYIGTTPYGSQISGNATNNTAVGVQTGGFAATTTYYATVFNHALAYVGSTGVTVTPQTPALTPISPANPSATTANGETIAFTTTPSGIYNTAITWWVDGVQGGNSAVGTIDATGHYTPGTTLGAHTIKAQLVNGTNVTTTVTVYAVPTCSLGASTTTPLYGASVNLTPTFTNDANNLATIGTTQGGSQVSAGLASAASVAVTPLTPTTYWARATNGAGLSVDGSVTVTPQTVTMSAISPANPSYTAYGGVLGTFSTTVSGAVNTGKSWYVDNILGGNATVGTINASGQYTAGTQMGAHTIKAVADANGTTQVTTTVTVVAPPDAYDIHPVVTPIPYGTAASLYVEFYGGTAKVGTGTTPGAQDISANATSGAYYSTGNLTVGTDFILTVTNSLGAVSTLEAHVDVNPPTSSGGKRSACASSC